MVDFTSPQLNIQYLEEEWSTPEDTRLRRTSPAKGMKVRRFDNNRRKLRGGYFLLNGQGNAVTLSVCYVGTDNKKFGLTVAHLADYTDEEGTAVRVAFHSTRFWSLDTTKITSLTTTV
jgi:hypothetical protein